MHIISQKLIREFVQTAEGRGAANALDGWYRKAVKCHWSSMHDVQQDFPSADLVGSCIVFNIQGNDYRLIARMIADKLYLLKIMTHKEYDRNRWPRDCGCHSPPPR